MIKDVATRFAASGLNLKTAFKAIVATDFYRADGIATVAEYPERHAELDDIGVVRLLTPEQMERKLNAIFGKRWGRLDEEFKILYGGIDSITVTERNADPSGAMGAIQRIMANDVACLNVGRDFHRPAAERILFAGIEASVVPGDGEPNRKIRETIVSLRSKLLGLPQPLDHPEVERTFQLFSGIIADAKAQPTSNLAKPTSAAVAKISTLKTRTTPSAPGAVLSHICCASMNSFTSDFRTLGSKTATD